MVRLARASDLPSLIQGMLQLKQSTGWSQYSQTGYNANSLHEYLTNRLYDSQSVLYVSCAPIGTISAFCGVSLSTFYLPPHMPIMFEWGWFGVKREAVQCWQAAIAWGKKRGAELAFKSHSIPTTNRRKIVEQQTWRIL